jgi:hypothetical protein
MGVDYQLIDHTDKVIYQIDSMRENFMPYLVILTEHELELIHDWEDRYEDYYADLVNVQNYLNESYTYDDCYDQDKVREKYPQYNKIKEMYDKLYKMNMLNIPDKYFDQFYLLYKEKKFIASYKYPNIQLQDFLKFNGIEINDEITFLL